MKTFKNLIIIIGAILATFGGLMFFIAPKISFISFAAGMVLSIGWTMNEILSKCED